jgi:hypothetical protein
MTSQTPDMQAVLERLERLERQNRRLKGLGLLTLVTVGALLLMGQAAPKSHTVDAEDFQLKDASGKLRGELGLVCNGQPCLRLTSSDGAVAALSGTPALLFVRREGDIKVFLGLKEGDPSVNLYGNGAMSSIGPTALAFYERVGKEDELRSALSALKGEPQLILRDRMGFTTNIGINWLQSPDTGERHTTSAASVAMFDKDGKVIWRAP